jgi:hypothetical protein
MGLDVFSSSNANLQNLFHPDPTFRYGDPKNAFQRISWEICAGDCWKKTYMAVSHEYLPVETNPRSLAILVFDVGQILVVSISLCSPERD